MIGVPPQDAVWSEPPAAVAISASVNCPGQMVEGDGLGVAHFQAADVLGGRVFVSTLSRH